jgi:two-component system OmpR family sensor kinase
VSGLRLPRTLTARLVAVAVLLVAFAGLLIGTATTLAMRSQLTQQLDDELRASIGRGFGGPGRGELPPEQFDDDSDDRPFLGQGYGAVLGHVAADGTGYAGVVAGDEGDVRPRSLDAAQVRPLISVAGEPEPRTVTLADLGSYRVLSRASERGGYDLAALPTADLDQTLEDLVRLELLATLLGVLAATGAGTWVVRRQLAPLRDVAATAHRVAELPLASGAIDIGERVPARLTDERTEVGQVGSALNAMLDHVEASLDQRHRSEQQVRQFVADASHELRTPLATIAGYTELARNRPETTPTALAKVETESARMTGLVEDLLLLARLDAGRPLERTQADLSRLLLEAVDDARVVDRDRSWRLALPDEPITVTGDAARLHQVVTNLLTNARKYTPAGSTVTVTGTPHGFTVHDDGPGFPADLAPRAFERFVRGDAARTRAGGAGLGLSLVEAIVEAHGGSVSLASAPGDTTITVRLPGIPCPWT